MRVATILTVGLMTLSVQLPAEQVFPDPAGDLIGLDEDGPDAVALVATDLGDALRLDIELTDPEATPSVTGLIEIDTGKAIDNLAAEDSSRPSRLSLLCPKPTGLGVDLTIDLFARQGEEVPVRDSADQVVGQASWEATVQGFAVTLDKQLIGHSTGNIALAAIIGDRTRASDCIPDAGASTRAGVRLHRVMVQASASAGGTMSPQGEIVADVNEPITFNFVPDVGHQIDTVNSSCGGSLIGLSFTTDPISQECSVEAIFVETPIDGECGPADDGVFTSAPKGGLCDAGDAGAISGDGPWLWACEGIAGGSNASCSADIQHYTLSYSAGMGGEISGEANQSIPHGSSGEPVSALPDAGYSFVEWNDGNTINPRIDVDVTDDLNVEAGFIEQTTTTLASSTGTAIVGEPVTFTITVIGTATAPESGNVIVEADTGETCTSAQETGTDNVLTYECQIDFTKPGTRSLVAGFSDSDSHEPSQSQPLQLQVVASELIFEDRFEQSSD